MAGEHLDISSEPPQREPAGENETTGRPFLGVHFACCGIYARVYLNAQRSSYDGQCPRCLRKVHFRVGPGGSDARFFTAY